MTGWSQAEPVPNAKGCWYRIEVEECPVCGRGGTYRTRMPAPAPKDDAERYEYFSHYDQCMEW